MTNIVNSTNKKIGIQLYRTILQCHKKYLYDNSMRILGNKYVRNEFKLHKNVTNVSQIQLFVKEWQNYIDQLTFTGQSQQILSDAVSSSTNSNNSNTNTNTNTSETSKSNNTSILYNSPPIIEIGQNLPNNIQLTSEQQQQLEKLRQEVFNTKETGN